jgi:phosphotriesterase-related protein
MSTNHESMPMSRREALERLGLAAGAGLTALLVPGVAGYASRVRPASLLGAAQEAGIIRTVLRDVPPQSLAGGAVLFHEHLSMKYPFGATSHVTDDVDLMIEEVKIAAGEGVSCIVDGGHPDMQRDLEALRRIASGSGMAIVASGGFYMQRNYPAELASMSADQIADELVREAARDRLGAFGEIGQQGAEMTADERKVFEAIGKVQARTGLPVFTHNAYSGRRASAVPRDAALRQFDLLVGAGARPEKLAIGHVCCLDDPNAEIAIEIARRGAFVGFDRVGLNAIMPDADRVVMAKALIEAGHADKLLLSADFYAANALKSRGGPGLAQPATVFGPMLTAAGVPAATVRRILVDNPIRFLTFTPRPA